MAGSPSTSCKSSDDETTHDNLRIAPPSHDIHKAMSHPNVHTGTIGTRQSHISPRSVQNSQRGSISRAQQVRKRSASCKKKEGGRDGGVEEGAKVARKVTEGVRSGRISVKRVRNEEQGISSVQEDQRVRKELLMEAVKRQEIGQNKTQAQASVPLVAGESCHSVYVSY